MEMGGGEGVGGVLDAGLRSRYLIGCLGGLKQHEGLEETQTERERGEQKGRRTGLEIIVDTNTHSL